MQALLIVILEVGDCGSLNVELGQHLVEYIGQWLTVHHGTQQPCATAETRG
jgi:hypothetical protein